MSLSRSYSGLTLYDVTAGSIYSTGHGSIVASGSNPKELYYPHHARPSPSDDRYLYTARLFVDPDTLYLGFGPDAGDLRAPTGVAPFSIHTTGSGNGTYNVVVKSATGAGFDLTNPINRISAEVADGGPGVTVYTHGDLLVVDGAAGKGKATVRVRYERARSNATAPWSAVSQFRALGDEEVVETTIVL